MPFRSKAQRSYLWANEPEVAKKWTEKYGSKIVHKKGTGGAGASPCKFKKREGGME